MRALVKKQGDGACVTIPLPVLLASNLSLEQVVDVREENGRIVVEPMTEDDLHTLISAITPENVHHEVFFGRPVGREVL